MLYGPCRRADSRLSCLTIITSLSRTPCRTPSEFPAMASSPTTEIVSPELRKRRLDEVAQAASVDTSRAMALALKAREDGAVDALVHHLVGLHHKDAGRLDEAVAELGLGLALEPENPRIMITVGFCLLEAGRRREAAQVFGVAVKLDPNSADASCGYGWAAESLGALDSAESGFKQPDYPTLFSRFNSSLIGDKAPIIRPLVSVQLDFEGEMVAVIGKGGRHISHADALDHVIAYSIFNDASIRDYQFKSPQWTVGKNFDDTGAFGPVLVTAEELPPGAKGLKLQTRLNGVVVQEASTSDMVFDVATLIATISEAITLKSGDVIVTGTPSGVGLGRKPPLFMKAGDLVEVEIEGIGVLTNPIVDEAA